MIYFLQLSTAWLIGLAVGARRVGAQTTSNDSPVSDAPSCAQEPLLGSITSSGCNANDLSCICSDSTALANLQKAVQNACTPADQQAVARLTSEWCPGTVVFSSLASISTFSSLLGSTSSSPTTTVSQYLGVASTVSTISNTTLRGTITVGASSPSETSILIDTSSAPSIDTPSTTAAMATQQSATLLMTALPIVTETSTAAPPVANLAPTEGILRYGFVVFGMGAMGAVFAEL